MIHYLIMCTDLIIRSSTYNLSADLKDFHISLGTNSCIELPKYQTCSKCFKCIRSFIYHNSLKEVILTYHVIDKKMEYHSGSNFPVPMNLVGGDWIRTLTIWLRSALLNSVTLLSHFLHTHLLETHFSASFWQVTTF